MVPKKSAEPKLTVAELGRWRLVEQFQKRMGVPIILMGFGLPDDDIHAPNEKINLSQFFRGIETVIHFLTEYSKL